MDDVRPPKVGRPKFLHPHFSFSMEVPAATVTARRLCEGGWGPGTPDATDLLLVHTVIAGHCRLDVPHGVADGKLLAVDLGACLAGLAAVAQQLTEGAAAVGADPVEERWRPPAGSTTRISLGSGPSVAGLIFSGLRGGGAVVCAPMALTAHPTAPMFVAVGVFAQPNAPPVTFAMLDPVLSRFVHADAPETWFTPAGPMQNAAMVLRPGEHDLEPLLVRACMYRVVQRVADARVGSTAECYDPAQLGTIARRCVADMPAAGAGSEDLAPPACAPGSPLCRSSRRRRRPAPPLALARDVVLGRSVATTTPPWLTSEFITMFIKCTAQSPTRYAGHY